MKRFLKVFVLLVVCLFVLVTGVDSTLDCLSRSPGQSAFTSYNEKGQPVFAYSGNLTDCRAYAKPTPYNKYRWF